MLRTSLRNFSEPNAMLTVVEKQSWGDELEFLCYVTYVLFYFARGSLPWQELKASTSGKKNMFIADKKVSLYMYNYVRDSFLRSFRSSLTTPDH